MELRVAEYRPVDVNSGMSPDILYMNEVELSIEIFKILKMMKKSHTSKILKNKE